jgi:two-component system phosphate regulon response regulator PhoB
MPRSRPTILVIEDERFLQRATQVSLRARDFIVLIASDGEEGLRLARSESPDLIVLDMMLPKMRGLKVLEALRADEATGALPVLVFSSSLSEADLAEANRLGIAGYLPKGRVSLKELCDEVARLVEGG